MRKVQQAKILEMLETLREAHDEVRKQRELEAMNNLLADCQAFALHIGQYIEAIEGEGTKTVLLLEEYCEIAFEVSLATDKAKQIKKLQSKLLDICDSVKSELNPKRIEIVFFPYQRSMWDSFESVYLAAKADPACDVYVVPIPWFEKFPDGTLGKMNCDASQYPSNIEITSWLEYDPEERQPDIIFIHNPYDAGNLVTSVHPNFYCERLHTCTYLLCYIPYFVSGDVVEPHFCVTPGCIYAHKTILESEKIRDDYIRVFTKTYGNLYGNPKNKFIALGSPKYDKVLSMQKEDCNLPAAWAELLENADGTRKKTILFNSSISEMLKNDERYLAKIREVLEIFKKHNDVVLWWRPHPLSEQTYESMRHELLAEYRKIIAEYKNERYGIYDDTPDLHRAIALSEGYFGDWSSVVYLYSKTEKPVVIRGYESTDTPFTLSFHSVCDHDGVYWGIDTSFNALFKINKTSLTASFVTFLSSEPRKPPAYAQTTCVANKLFFTPRAGNFFMIYDIDSDTQTDIQIQPPQNRKNYDDSRKFYQVATWEDAIFFFGDSFPGIVKINAITHEVTYYEDIFPENKGIGHTRGLIQHGSVVTTIHKSSQSIISVDLRTMDVKKQVQLNFYPKSFSKKEQFCVELCEANGSYYSSLVNGNTILKIGKEDNSFTTIDIPPKLTGKEHNHMAVACGGWIWFVPVLKDVPIRLNPATDEVTLACDLLPCKAAQSQEGENLTGYMGPFDVHEDGFVCIERSTSMLVVCNADQTAHRQGMITLDDAQRIEMAIGEILRGNASEEREGNIAGKQPVAGAKIFNYLTQAIRS
ncbi:CDP-glycerol glycerophosphotransferase family protein [Ruminococcaceae bacterium OttesenSCG-928-D13]|nr:CDP-glycerol glycerophosphotransferase family protein [Ruminococcaceae bacterium OttesenSCG-928-D13]